MTNLLGVFLITAYTWTGSPCANGHYPVEGITCAVPASIPLGTWLEIGSELYRADDRINRRFPNRIDIYVGGKTNPTKAIHRAKRRGIVPKLVRIFGRKN